MVVAGHRRLPIWVLLSVIRGLAVASLPWMLDLLSSRQTVFVETVFIWAFGSVFFETVVLLLNVMQLKL
jgi:hypothetical protein